MQINSDILSSIAPFLSTISHTPGRLRVRVNPKIKQLDIPFGDIESSVKNIDGIKNIKFNKLIASVTIEYDTSKLPFDFWESLISGKNSDYVAGVISKAGVL